MQKVLGFGGLFLRSKDPTALAAWYLKNLGIDLVPQNMEDKPWIAEGGATVFAPFPADTDYFAADKQFMINFRVADMQAMVDQLKAAGIDVKNEVEMEGLGKFAHLVDPEGTPIELWEPTAR